MLISRYCETDWARKSSRSGGWSPRRLRGGQLLGTWAGRLHSGECFLGGHLCLKKKAQLKKGEHVTSLNRNQEGGGCLVWHQANGFLVLSLAACPWRYCLHVGRTPPAASPVLGREHLSYRSLASLSPGQVGAGLVGTGPRTAYQGWRGALSWKP